MTRFAKLSSTQPAYCRICGDDQTIGTFRFWGPDDGWLAGGLCRYCAEDCKKRGPEKGDYAYDKCGPEHAETIEVLAEILGDDLDSMMAMLDE